MKSEKFKLIESRIREGWTFRITTYTKSIEINLKTLEKWRKAGIPLLKNDESGEGFYIARGRSYDYIIPASVSLGFYK